MPKLVWLNGELMPLESATTSVADHAHLYGDGLFEGIRIYHHRVFRLDEHLERLYHGCSYLGFDMTIGLAELRALVLDTCAKAELTDGYVRLNVTRGTGLGLDPKKIDPKPNVMIMVSSLALYPPEIFLRGLSVAYSSMRVIPRVWLDTRVKCIGRYASNILAKHLANRVGADEGLMLNHQGYVAEGTGNNLFLVSGRTLRTPHPSSGILQGITRGVVIELARAAGYEVTEELLTPYDMRTASEAFFCGTATEVMPMTSLDSMPIGDGKPGPVTQDIMTRFAKETHNGVAF